MAEPHIDKITIYPYRLPLRGQMVTGHGKMEARCGALVELRADSSISGWGEIAPLPEFAGCTLPEALAALDLFAPLLQARPLSGCLTDLDGADLPSPVICGLESALLDALGQYRGWSVSHLLSGYGRTTGPRREVPVNAVVGMPGVEAAVEGARAAVAAGYRCVKLKVGGREVDAEVERVAAVRSALAAGVHLRLDANEAWTYEQAYAVLNRCADYQIQYVEQPLPAKDLAGMRRLRANLPICIAADEAVLDLASALRVLEERAADVLIVKPQLAGGLRAGLRIMQAAAAVGVQSVVTSTIESGIGIAGALHLAAALPTLELECGLATLSLLSDDFLQDGIAISAGRMLLPSGPGLGISPDKIALARYAANPMDLG